MFKRFSLHSLIMAVFGLMLAVSFIVLRWRHINVPNLYLTLATIFLALYGAYLGVALFREKQYANNNKNSRKHNIANTKGDSSIEVIDNASSNKKDAN